MLTELDKKILIALRDDGRASWSALAKRFSVSRVTIQNRVESMRVRKIIKGYTVVANVNSAKAGISEEKAFFMLQFVAGDSFFGLCKLLSTSPHVLGIWCVAGEWDCFVLVSASSLREVAKLREHIFDKIKIKKLETHPVLNDCPSDFVESK